jgi:hypothetical protein
VEINMTKFAKAVGAWVAALMLASCGGGGGSGNDGGFTAPGLRVAITPAQSQTTPFSLVDVPVRVTAANGAAVQDGTQVTVQVSSGSIGLVSSLQRAGTGPLIGERITATTSGGTALFRFHSRAVGAMTLTATARDQASGSAQVSASAGITVAAGAPTDPRLQVVAQTTTLPINRFGVSPFLGSPFLTEVTVTWRRLNGELVTVVPEGRNLVAAVSVNPVNPAGGFSMLDDPETEDDPATPEIENNEFLTIMGQAPVDIVAGRANIFFHSFNEAGQAVMTVTTQDPDTDETLQALLTFTSTSGTPPLPASISLERTGRHVYASDAGGNKVDQLEAYVYDAVGSFVPDPSAGSSAWNNLRLEIVGGAQGGERLRAVNAQNQTVSGGSISVRTFQGIGAAAFESGTRLGALQIRATADRADNNVDNGISDPVSSLVSITVGDGRLFDLDITTPISENAQEIVFGASFNNASSGVYQFPVSVLATDRFGNPVVPGTEIRFGVIDGPHSNGTFAIYGGDGDPQEAGTNFSAPTGQFQTAGGGAGPNDTLIVFGEQSNGNRDLESARRVASVASNTSLTVTQRFNYNDDTGATVNNGPVLPYIIGHAEDATIGTSGLTDQNGMTAVLLTYPVGKLAKLTAIFAQGNGDVVNGTPELITDAEYLRLPGIAPGILVASPDPIAGNTTLTMLVCLRDATGQGVPGVALQFTFEDLFGNGSVDGTPNQGFLGTLTGADGCARPTVVTSGVPPSDTTQPIIPKLRFFVPGSDNGEGEPIQDTVDIRVNTNWYLYAFPNITYGDGGRLITLRLVDSSGARVPGVLIVASCEADDEATLTISTHPGVTDANGETIAVVDGAGFDVPGGDGPSGSCIFRTVNDEAETEVLWRPRDICDGFSPSPPIGCDAAELRVSITGTGNVLSTMPSSIINCNGPGTCTGRFSPFANVTLQASSNLATWSGNCSLCTGATCTVALGDDGTTTTCGVVFP